VPSSTFIALLRGVNVGRNNRIAMADLRALLGDLGYEGVRTHLQSGNAVFGAPRASSVEVGAALERELDARLELAVPVIVRTREELAAAVAANPFAGEAETDPSHLLVNFLSDAVDAALAGELEGHEPNRFHVAEREVYVWCPNGFQGTSLTYSLWERLFGVTATARNWRTTTRLLDLADELAQR
jgi:uncharacterized protein (DUF1697 family)